MKYQIIFIFFVVLLSGLGLTQDLIVTTSGDSIHCRITKVDNEYVHFTFKYNDEFRRTLLSVNDVKEKQKNYFETPVVTDEMLEPVHKNAFRGALYGGYSYRTAPVSADMSSLAKEYIEELKSGFNISGDFHYYISDVIGYGAMFSVYRSQNEIASLALADEITISYIGPSAQTRLETGKGGSLHLVSSVSLGYLKYIDEAKAEYNFKIDSGTMGLMFGIGADFNINDKFGVTFSINYLQGILTEFTISSDGESETVKLDKGNYESLNRLDFNVGFYFFN